jgi:hypothetical protein
MSNNKSISPHLIKLYDSTSLSKNIINIIQVYLLPDINQTKLNKSNCEYQLTYEIFFQSIFMIKPKSTKSILPI